MSKLLSPERRKALGAYYTDERLVDFLVSWGLRGRAEGTVMDPSCGDGRFLVRAAAAGPGIRLLGCDIDPRAMGQTRGTLGEMGAEAELVEADFFRLLPERFGPVDLVVGNPPFIRYQRFQGDTRRRALESALRLGVRLSRLSSSWAPFLLHAVQFLREGGDLAMVVPAEITQAQYGLVTLRALLSRFREVRLLVFENNLFAGAQEETCLLLARGYGGSSRQIGFIPVTSLTELADVPVTSVAAGSEVVVAVTEGEVVRFVEALLKPAQRRTLKRVRELPAVRPVASLAAVTNGYVTGDNRFFHRTQEQAAELGLPSTWLYPTIRSSRSLRGLRFTREDLFALERGTTAHHLVVPQDDLFARDGEALRRLISEGEREGVHQRYKCRTRDPWWRVPGLQEADVVVAYMAGTQPRAAVNQARAFYTNSLHGLRLRDGVPAELVVLSFLTSLTLLSLEIEGRSYGGGVLKWEPRELDRVLLACPRMPPARLADLARQVDLLLRQKEYEGAVELADQKLLIEGLGLNSADLKQLRSARQRLLTRRTDRSRSRRGKEGDES